MENLAKELVAQILGCLTPHDVLRVESVCRLWREISVTDHALWQKYYEKETGIVQKEKESTDRSAVRNFKITHLSGVQISFRLYI